MFHAIWEFARSGNYANLRIIRLLPNLYIVSAVKCEYHTCTVFPSTWSAQQLVFRTPHIIVLAGDPDMAFGGSIHTIHYACTVVDMVNIR